MLNARAVLQPVQPYEFSLAPTSQICLKPVTRQPREPQRLSKRWVEPRHALAYWRGLRRRLPMQ